MPDPSFFLSGDLDLRRADQLEPGLLAHAESTPGDTVVIDCSELTFIDSSGLGMLVDVHNQSGKRLRLQQVPEACRNAFVVTGLDAMFGLA
ncbi:MAG TPA: STAS domain-containing protein [Acidimicrobiia bacterium]|nr:STAS domain-containing protein [Acidimicrobiia bacterium]